MSKVLLEWKTTTKSPRIFPKTHNFCQVLVHPLFTFFQLATRNFDHDYKIDHQLLSNHEFIGRKGFRMVKPVGITYMLVNKILRTLWDGRENIIVLENSCQRISLEIQSEKVILNEKTCHPQLCFSRIDSNLGLVFNFLRWNCLEFRGDS